uniref:Uncharacterized protein n=1 Tax=Ixodes ricinus TaxID=34613 RepID=A0A6B0UUD0_IXORI
MAWIVAWIMTWNRVGVMARRHYWKVARVMTGGLCRVVNWITTWGLGRVVTGITTWGLGRVVTGITTWGLGRVVTWIMTRDARSLSSGSTGDSHRFKARSTRSLIWLLAWIVARCYAKFLSCGSTWDSCRFNVGCVTLVMAWIVG